MNMLTAYRSCKARPFFNPWLRERKAIAYNPVVLEFKLKPVEEEKRLCSCYYSSHSNFQYSQLYYKPLAVIIPLRSR